MTDRELMQMALDAIEGFYPSLTELHNAHTKTAEALRARLAQPELKPEGDLCCGDYDGCIRPCTPRGRWIAHKAPQREWQGLTDEAVWNLYKNLWMFHPAEEPRLAGDILKFARAIEAKLKEKNT